MQNGRHSPRIPWKFQTRTECTSHLSVGLMVGIVCKDREDMLAF